MSLLILGATPGSLGSNIKVQSCQNMTWLLTFNHTTAWGQSKNIFVHGIKKRSKFWRYCCYECWAYPLIWFSDFDYVLNSGLNRSWSCSYFIDFIVFTWFLFLSFFLFFFFFFFFPFQGGCRIVDNALEQKSNNYRSKGRENQVIFVFIKFC